MKVPTMKGTHFSFGKRKSIEPKISVETRLREYPEQGFVNEHNKLRCKSCKKDLPLIKSSIESHIKSDKHVKKLKRTRALEQSDKILAEEITDYFE